jgi:predicted RNase H-like HicB family nuclease
MNKREFTVIVERGEDGYLLGSAPELPGCHTQARTLEQLMERMQEAIELYLEAREDGESGRLELVGIHRIAV